MEFVDLCRKLIAIDSTTTNGNGEITKFLSSYCEQVGLSVEVLPETTSDGGEQYNLVVKPQWAHSPVQELLLHAHMDTPDPGPYGTWTKTQQNPFKASIHGDEIYGLGSADAKLDLLCKITAAKEFAQQPLSKEFVVSGSYGEDQGMAGILKLIRRKKMKPQKALVGKPTSLQLQHSGPGLAIVDVFFPFSEDEKGYRQEHDLQESTSSQSKVFTGRSAHSAFSHLGENALMKMLDYLAQLPSGIAILAIEGGHSPAMVPGTASLEFDMVGSLATTVVEKLIALADVMKRVELELQAFPSKDVGPDTSTLNLGMIRTYEDHIQATVGCRLLPSVPEEVYDQLIARLRDAAAKVGASFRVRDYKKAFSTHLDSPWVKGCQEELKALKLSEEVFKGSMPTEANILGRLGIECLVFGPGEMAGNSHAANERVRLSDLKKAIEFYQRVIRRFCL